MFYIKRDKRQNNQKQPVNPDLDPGIKKENML